MKKRIKYNWGVYALFRLYQAGRPAAISKRALCFLWNTVGFTYKESRYYGE